MNFLDVMTLIGSFVVIVLVILFTYYASRWYARKAVSSAGRHIKIIDRASLTQGSALCIVEVGEKHYMVGVSEKNIQLITELEGFDPGHPEENTSRVPFQKVLGDLMAKARTDKKKDGEGRG